MPKNYQISQYDEPIAHDGWVDVDVPDRRRAAHGPDRDRARAHGGGHRQDDAPGRPDRPHPRRGLLPRRLQPRRHPADRDRHQADRRGRCARARGGQGVRRRAARAGRRAGGLRRAHAPGLAALRRQRVAAPRRRTRRWAPVRRPRTSTRCGRWQRAVRYEMSRQAAVLDGGGRVVQETRHWHEDTGVTTSGPQQGGGRGLPVLPRARPGAGRAGRRVRSRSCGRRCPSCRRRTAGGCRSPGASPTSRCSPSSTPARWSSIEATVAAGADPAAARNWWLGELARLANERGVEVVRAADHPRGRRAGRSSSSRRGPLTDDAGPAGGRGRARRRGLARRGRRGPRAAGGRRRRRAAGRHRRRAGRRTPTSPRRSAAARSPRPARSSAPS